MGKKDWYTQIVYDRQNPSINFIITFLIQTTPTIAWSVGVAATTKITPLSLD